MSRGNHKGKGGFKKGVSGNPGGRPKVAQEYARKRAHELVKELHKIAMRQLIEIKDEKGAVLDVDQPKDADKISAIKELMKIGGQYPAEQTEQKVTVEGDSTKNVATDEIAKQAFAEVVGLKVIDGGKK